MFFLFYGNIRSMFERMVFLSFVTTIIAVVTTYMYMYTNAHVQCFFHSFANGSLIEVWSANTRYFLRRSVEQTRKELPGTV